MIKEYTSDDERKAIVLEQKQLGMFLIEDVIELIPNVEGAENTYRKRKYLIFDSKPKPISDPQPTIEERLEKIEKFIEKFIEKLEKQRPSNAGDTA